MYLMAFISSFFYKFLLEKLIKEAEIIQNMYRLRSKDPSQPFVYGYQNKNKSIGNSSYKTTHKVLGITKDFNPIV